MLVSIWREVLYNIIDQFGVHKNLQLSPLLIKHHTMTAQPQRNSPKYPVNRRLGKPHSFGNEKISSPPRN